MNGEAPRPFEGELVRLRAPERTDAARLNALFDDADVRVGLTMIWPQSLAGISEFLAEARVETSSETLVIETTAEREPIGLCSLEGIDPRTRSAEFGIWVGKAFWDRGYGTDATRTMCRWGFRFANLHRITLHVLAANARALRAYEKVGFRLEGSLRGAEFRDGRHVDLLVMGLLEDEIE